LLENSLFRVIKYDGPLSGPIYSPTEVYLNGKLYYPEDRILKKYIKDANTELSNIFGERLVSYGPISLFIQT
jgi:hypothetical protein